jgi:chromosome segregation ATPase
MGWRDLQEVVRKYEAALERAELETQSWQKANRDWQTRCDEFAGELGASRAERDRLARAVDSANAVGEKYQAMFRQADARCTLNIRHYEETLSALEASRAETAAAQVRIAELEAQAKTVHSANDDLVNQHLADTATLRELRERVEKLWRCKRQSCAGCSAPPPNRAR